MWFLIALIIAVVLAFLLSVLRSVLGNVIVSRAEWGEGQTFVCPNCGHEFYVPVTRFGIVESGEAWNLSDRNKRVLKCPACGKRDLCVMRDHRI